MAGLNYRCVKRLGLSKLFLVAGIASAQIELPPPPSAAPPPSIPVDSDPAVLRKAEKEDLKSKEAEEIKEKQVHKADEKMQELAKVEATKPRPLYGFMEWSLLYPKVAASGDRKEYNADVTTHFNFWMRLNLEKPIDSVQIWAGFRLAPFVGYGTQGQQNGRYALTYFGPGIGFGKLSPTSDATSDSPTRNGWLIAAGISAVSRHGDSKEAHPDESTDFKTASAAFDSPGIWTEVRAMHLFNGALSSNLILGAQLAEQKNFFYFGIGFAGWL